MPVKTTTHAEVRAQLLADPEVKAEYDRLEPVYNEIRQVIEDIRQREKEIKELRAKLKVLWSKAHES